MQVSLLDESCHMHNKSFHFVPFLKMTKTLRTLFNPETFSNIYKFIIIFGEKSR